VPNETKQRLRTQVLARRDALTVEERIEGSLALTAYAGNIDVPAGGIVSGFSPIRSEIDIRPLMAELREAGSRLCLPAILDRTTIVFRELVRGAALIDTGFGTVGPGPDAAELAPDVMLVPLAAFDRGGYRIGYGAGHYDRAIARLHDRGLRPLLIGVGFDLQEVDAVPREAHDVAMHAILTPSGLRFTEPRL
jgi:5-formyltetrahydrofolate cyclo-ligase